MNAKQKLFFLVNHIDKLQWITPTGSDIRIHPVETLNNKFSKQELHGAMQKLSKDLGVIKITNTPDPDPFAFTLNEEDTCFFIQTTSEFEKYKEDLEYDIDYRTFTYGLGGIAEKVTNKPSLKTIKKPIAVIDIPPKYNKDFDAIVFMNEIIKIPKNSIQTELCNVVFASKKSMSQTWDFDSILEEIDQNNELTKKEIDRLYRAARAINDHIAKTTTIKDFLVITTKTVAINPNYR